LNFWSDHKVHEDRSRIAQFDIWDQQKFALAGGMSKGLLPHILSIPKSLQGGDIERKEQHDYRKKGRLYKTTMTLKKLRVAYPAGNGRVVLRTPRHV
jgi:hypothetical protein